MKSERWKKRWPGLIARFSKIRRARSLSLARPPGIKALLGLWQAVSPSGVSVLPLSLRKMRNTGDATGSGRSVAGVDIGAAVRGAVEAGIAKKGGGHSMAAGLTVEQSRMAELTAYLRNTLSSPFRAASAAPTLPVDGALGPRAATLEFAEILEKAGPFRTRQSRASILRALGAGLSVQGNHGRASSLRPTGCGWRPDQRSRFSRGQFSLGISVGKWPRSCLPCRRTHRARPMGWKK